MDRDKALEILRRCADQKIEINRAMYALMDGVLEGLERVALHQAERLRDLRVVDR